jgi:hypothetical protein
MKSAIHGTSPGQDAFYLKTLRVPRRVPKSDRRFYSFRLVAAPDSDLIHGFRAPILDLVAIVTDVGTTLCPPHSIVKTDSELHRLPGG